MTSIITSNSMIRELSINEICLVSGAWDWGDFASDIGRGALGGAIGGAVGGAAVGSLAGGVGAIPGAGVGALGGGLAGGVGGGVNYIWDEIFD